MASVALLLLTCNAVMAIAPDRPLTQSIHRIWQTQQGLPATPILSLLQTQDGYLWLGTQKGLYRFDGIRFTEFPHTDEVSLDSLWIQDLHEDASGNLWIATDGAGLIRLGQGTARQHQLADGLPSDDVRCVATDSAGALWVATAAGLARLAETSHRDTKSFEIVSPGNFRALSTAPSGDIWAAGDGNQLTVWNGHKIAARTIQSLPAHGSVYALLCSPDGAVWIGTSDGLVRLKDGHERRYTTADGLASDHILCLKRGADGVLWIGTREGFSRLAGGEIASFDARDGLSQSTVFCLCEDREGSLWVGTKHGLNQFLDRRTLLYTTREGLPSNDAGPVLQDAEGRIWVGTLGAGLARLEGRSFEVLTTGDGLVSNSILALADGGDGQLWIGTSAGLNRLADGRIDATFTTEQGLPADEVRCICRDRSGTLWVGTAAGLAQLRGGRFVQPVGEPEILRTPLRALVEHRAGVLFAAAEGGGLYRCASGELSPYQAGNLDHWIIDTLFEDDLGLLWIGTEGHGLHLLDGDRIRHFTTKDGLYDDEIFGIVADDQQRLWMACSSGVFFVSRDDLRKFAAGQITSLTSTPFSPMDSLRTIECKSGVQPSLFKMQDGRIWFSTIRGLIVIDPKNLQRVLPPTPVVVEDVVVNGKNERPDQVRRLSPGQTNLEFRYTALSFATPTRTTFRYRLVGFDKQWVDAGSRREAFYTNLSPGTYRFELAARLLEGPWQAAQHPVEFTLEPHFYQARWFLPLCAALLMLAGWGAYRLRVRHIKGHLRVVVAERSRIARELHDTLMQGFSGVTMEMQALSARLDASPERRTLDEIIRDAGICLREARRSVAGLRNSHGDETGLSAAIAQAARHLTETQDVRLRLNLQRSPPELADDTQYNLLRIAQEAITNAIKHSSARTIEVDLDCLPDRLQLAIRDDGVGLGTRDGNRPQPGHYGLIGMRERASQIGAELHVESTPGQGTTVRVDLPLASGRTGAPPPAQSISGTLEQ